MSVMFKVLKAKAIEEQNFFINSGIITEMFSYEGEEYEITYKIVSYLFYGEHISIKSPEGVDWELGFCSNIMRDYLEVGSKLVKYDFSEKEQNKIMVKLWKHRITDLDKKRGDEAERQKKWEIQRAYEDPRIERLRELKYKVSMREKYTQEDIDYTYGAIISYYSKIQYEILPNMENQNTRNALNENYERLTTILEKYYTNKHIRKDYKDGFFKDFITTNGDGEIWKMFVNFE